MNMSVPSSSNRILYDVPCAVCRDHSSGKHYGVFACDGCAGFFKRSVRRDRQYTCKARTRGRCLVDKAHRNQCRACRLAKCLDVGMNRDAVQHERGPRNSTIRRQMAMYFEDPAPAPVPPPESGLALPPPLNLALNKQNILAPLPLMLYPTPYYTRLRYIAPLIQPTGEPAPNLVMPTEAHALCESAARILFLNVKWVKSVPALASLPLADRLILLVESWRDLFVLATAQFLYPLQLRLLVSSDTSASVKDGLEAFERALSEIARVRPDTTEFTCLRGMMVFKTSFNGRREPQQLTLQDIATVAALQDYSRSILNEYIAQTYSLEAARLSQIYDLLDVIRLVPGQAIVDLFFRSTIGEIPIERIICDMFRSEINGAL